MSDPTLSDNYFENEMDLDYAYFFFRKRRSSTNYKDHIALEKLTIKLGKTLKKYLSCYVVCAGVCYGNGEQTLHSFFKQAWLGEQSLPIYGTAHNGQYQGSADDLK